MGTIKVLTISEQIVQETERRKALALSPAQQAKKELDRVNELIRQRKHLTLVWKNPVPKSPTPCPAS
jgi:hypothetical protein